MNDVDRVLGRRWPISEVTTASAVPVVATVPASRFAKRKNGGKNDNEAKAKRARLVSGVLGMTEAADDESLFPEDAEELKGSSNYSPGVYNNKPKFKKADPDSPKGSTEQLLTPKAALVAPDVTPDSMTEIDPSEVPGAGSSFFTVADVTAAAASQPAAPGADTFTTAMDTLLGRNRGQSAPPPQQPQANVRPAPVPESMQPPISPESAAAMFSHVDGEALLKQGQPMDDPVVGDVSKICNAFRRFV